MYSLDLLLEAVLLCILGSQLVTGKSLRVAVASNIQICDFPCEKQVLYFLERASKERIMDFSCMDRPSLCDQHKDRPQWRECESECFLQWGRDHSSVDMERRSPA
ncbi:uncharacterized protein LOC121397184 isoform X4 [Xenopus laevis]|uniref:Uncharacterized protein LOC121397184 isoform X4 n=1 Tax=Xenopus laevis TaxID=8355 RepID=A0A8J1LJD8_XENLA|nr:uncharacterized protein LOC121397184 isoform X4 [Xenopus laevis]